MSHDVRIQVSIAIPPRCSWTVRRRVEKVQHRDRGPSDSVWRRASLRTARVLGSHRFVTARARLRGSTWLTPPTVITTVLTPYGGSVLKKASVQVLGCLPKRHTPAIPRPDSTNASPVLTENLLHLLIKHHIDPGIRCVPRGRRREPLEEAANAFGADQGRQRARDRGVGGVEVGLRGEQGGKVETKRELWREGELRTYPRTSGRASKPEDSVEAKTSER